ncbi:MULTISPECIES: N-acetylmuramoyl-L-alanine amidase [unclassified Roseovarius]|uniref:N-acetylmuramoyl-L-alanine amidase family protein n=1 Tax=unclassified Roseovarius TaxID=2614913 RepID=UPI00273D8DD5|nr:MULTISPECIES: N-acetylmuramoyl-L-alanine amidase [unclassified Roseovarius]
MKLGVIVGHTQNSQGAYSPTLQAYEYTWNSDLAQRIQNTATHLTIRTFFRDNVGIAGAYQASDAFGSDITVELHFNSSHNTSSKGTGILYCPGSTRGRSFATLLFEEMDAVLGFGDWPQGSGGVVTPFQASGQQRRGETSLKSGRAPATLIEPFFGSNPTECASANANKTNLASAIVTAAERYMNL